MNNGLCGRPATSQNHKRWAYLPRNYSNYLIVGRFFSIAWRLSFAVDWAWAPESGIQCSAPTGSVWRRRAAMTSKTLEVTLRQCRY